MPSTANIAMKYTQAALDATPKFFSPIRSLRILAISGLLRVVKESMMVYTTLSRMYGPHMGNVIFQKFTHAVAPSMLEDSNRDGEMVFRPPMKMMICRPDLMMMS